MNYIELRERKIRRLKHIFITLGILIAKSIIILLIFLLSRKSKEVQLNLIDSFTIIFAITLFVAWIMTISNVNLFTSVTYSLNKLFNRRVKDEKLDYFDYISGRKKVSKEIIYTTYLYALTSLIVLIVLFSTYK